MKVSKEIIQGCLDQDKKAQQALYKILYSPMLKICRRYYINREDALTAFHNGLLKIWSNMHKYHYQKSFENWARVLIVNGIIDDIRKNKRRLEIEKKLDVDEVEPAKEQWQYNLVESHMDWEYVERLLHSLPEASRIVFNMYVFEGYKHPEIARELGISEGTSRWHLSNARNIMKAHLPEGLKQKHESA